jgi:hypothetical protein
LDKKLLTNILDYWFVFEFFTPVSLPKGELIPAQNDRDLPWLKKTRQSSYVSCYSIYFGLFKTEMAIEVILSDTEDTQFYDIPSGTTYAGKLLVDNRGMVDVSNIELSTFPWAVGKFLARSSYAQWLREFQKYKEFVALIWTRNLNGVKLNWTEKIIPCLS